MLNFTVTIRADKPENGICYLLTESGGLTTLISRTILDYQRQHPTCEETLSNLTITVAPKKEKVYQVIQDDCKNVVYESTKPVHIGTIEK